MPSQFTYPLPIIGLGVASIVCAACTQPHMVVPADVGQGMDVLVVDGRSQASGLFVNEDFKMPPYQVVNVSRGVKHGSKFGAFGGFKSSAEAGYSFDFKSGDQTTHGECTSETSESGFSVGGNTISKQSAKLGCACGNESAPVASVVMGAETGGSYGGTLKAHSDTFQLKAIYEREGALNSDSQPAGYRVDGQGAVAAVDVLGKGRVWIQKKLGIDQRADIACVFAGLLLYKPPKE
jgi:hypothetical protein